MLTVILLDVRRLEVLRVLDVVESPAQGLEAIGIVRKLCSVSCVDDIPCVHDGVGYLFPVVPMVVVVAVWLRSRSLVCWWLATPRAMTAPSLPIFLIFLVLLLRLLLTIVASGSTTFLRYDCCSSPRSRAVERGQRVLSFELFINILSEIYDSL